jgi:hypothetical protein
MHSLYSMLVTLETSQPPNGWLNCSALSNTVEMGRHTDCRRRRGVGREERERKKERKREREKKERDERGEMREGAAGGGGGRGSIRP